VYANVGQVSGPEPTINSGPELGRVEMKFEFGALWLALVWAIEGYLNLVQEGFRDWSAF